MVFIDYQGKTIRLTQEQWEHINKRHPEVLGKEELIEQTIATPDLIQEGNKGELLAVKRFKKTPISDNKYCIVVYRYKDIDGFIITVYFTRRPSFRRRLIWKR